MKQKLLFIIHIPNEIQLLENLIDFILLAYSCNFQVTLIFNEINQKIPELFVKKILGLLNITDSKLIYCLSDDNTFISDIVINHCSSSAFQNLLALHDEVIVL